MSVLDIHVLGSPVLRQDTEPVGAITPALQMLVANLYETMHAARGIGLAAPQVGRRERVAVVEVDAARLTIINPEILERVGKETAEEGCLSIPDIYGDVERPARVVVRAMDLDGTVRDIAATGLLARCLQHEIDHLHGTLFIDYLSLLKRRAALAKWEKLRGEDRALTRQVTAPEIARHHHTNEEL